MEGASQKCERCNIFVPAGSYAKHLQEKRHRLREKRFSEMMQNSVFLSCLPYNVEQSSLLEVLKKFGKIRSCSFLRRSNTAVAEFEQRESAEKCLRGPVYIAGTLIRTAPRREPKTKAVPVPVVEADVDPTELVAVIEKAQSSGLTDIDKLIDLTVETVRLQDPERRNKMLLLQRDLEDCISELIPNCRALPFGSAVTGVPLKGSDADIVIVLPSGAATNDIDVPRLVRRVRKLLWSRQRKFGSIVAIPEARIPIVKLVHIPTSIACDVSFQGPACVIKSKQLSCLLDIDCRIRALIIFLKYWEKCHNIISLSRFSSYAATLMVVFFLQQPPEPILPPIHVILHSGLGEQKMTVTNKESLSRLVERFFRYYSETNLVNQVICPWLGCLVPCEAFSQTSESVFSEDIEHVKKLMQAYSNPLEINTSLVVQDPYELNRNVTERVKSKDVTFFRLCCAEALKVIERGEPAFLFKNFHVPSEMDICTTLRAEQFLKPKYLGPIDADTTAAREMLFTRWVNAVVALLPEFLTRFVRLKVEPCDDVTRNLTEPCASASKDYIIFQYLPRRWKCSGRPLLHTWKKRRKAASVLKLDPKLSMLDRESYISEHLEQEASETETVSFTFLVTAVPQKEAVRCSFITYTADGGVFRAITEKLISLIPLWVRDAFESGIGLNYVSGFCSLSSKDTDSNLTAGTNVCYDIEQSPTTEENVGKTHTDK